MFSAYILRSLKDGTYYYGHSKDVEERLKVHNQRKQRYTKGHVPYVLHYSEQYNTRKEAAAREKYFKSMNGYNWLKSHGII